LTPPADHSIQLQFLPGGTVILPNGTESKDKLLLKRADRDPAAGFEKQPRGILLSVENTTFWQECLECFSSIPVSNLGLENPEPWFTPNHTHDK